MNRTAPGLRLYYRRW